jgi:copper homeostasis protein (lipoprotein)
MKLNSLLFLLLVTVSCLSACKEKPKEKANQPIIYKGMYSFGPDEKSFKDCNGATTFWVVDSSNKLELEYSKLIASEQPYVPVYVEVTGEKVLSVKGDAGVAFDSTLVVYKVIKIVKEIPASCN